MFTARIDFRVEGWSNTTKVPFYITLSLGEHYKKKISVLDENDRVDVININVSNITPLPDPPSDTGGNELLDDVELEVVVEVRLIKVPKPLKKQSNGQSANQEETSDSNQNEN